MAPALIGAIGLGASAAGGAVGAVGSLVSGSANSAMYNYQAGVAQQNQQIAKQNEEYSLQTGENQASVSGLKSRNQIGQIVAAQAASGFNINEGTQKNVVAGQQLTANTEQTTIRSNAAKQAYDYDVNATQYQNQAAADQAAAKNAETAGIFGALTSVIGGAGSVSTKWLQGRQEGLWGTG